MVRVLTGDHFPRLIEHLIELLVVCDSDGNTSSGSLAFEAYKVEEHLYCGALKHTFDSRDLEEVLDSLFDIALYHF